MISCKCCFIKTKKCSFHVEVYVRSCWILHTVNPYPQWSWSSQWTKAASGVTKISVAFSAPNVDSRPSCDSISGQSSANVALIPPTTSPFPIRFVCCLDTFTLPRIYLYSVVSGHNKSTTHFDGHFFLCIDIRHFIETF